MITKEIADLLIAIAKEEKPKARHELLMAFAVAHPSEIPALQPVLAAFTELVEKKRQQGLSSPRGRKNAGKKKASAYRIPKFFTDYRGGDCCQACSQIVDPGASWRHKDGNNYKTWHVVCVPEESKSILESDKDYLRYRYSTPTPEAS